MNSKIDNKNKPLEEWVINKYKDEIDKSSIRHPVMTLVRTKADEKIQELLKKFYQTNDKLKSDIKHFNEKDFSIFSHENIRPSIIDRFILYPCYKTYKSLEKLNKELNLYENAKKLINNLRLAKYTIYFTDYIDNLFEIKFNKFLELKETKNKTKISKNLTIKDSKVNNKTTNVSNSLERIDKFKKVENDGDKENNKKKIGLISNLDQIKTVKNVNQKHSLEESKCESIPLEKEDKKNGSLINKIKNLLKSETNKQITNDSNSKKIGLAAIVKNPTQITKKEDEKIDNAETPIVDLFNIKNNFFDKIQIKKEPIKEELTYKEKPIKDNSPKLTIIEEIEENFKNLKEYKPINDNKNLIPKQEILIYINEENEQLNEEKEKINTLNLEGVSKDKINIKDLKLNFKTWYFFRFICSETRHQLKFYQGLKSKNIFIDKTFKEIMEIYEKNLFYEAKLSSKRIANFWRIAFSIKPDYIVDFELPKNKFQQKNKNKFQAKSQNNLLVNQKTLIKIGEKYSIFYKLFFLATPLNFKLGSFAKLIILSGFGLLAKMRYNIYKNNKIELDKQNYLVDNYLINQFNIPKDENQNKFLNGDESDDFFDNKKITKLKSFIFNPEKDDFFLKLMGLENILLDYSKNLNEIPITDNSTFENDITEQKLNFFFERNKLTKNLLYLIDKDLLKLYNDLQTLTETQNYLNIAFKNTLILSYSFYNLIFLSLIKRKIFLKYAFGKTLIFSFCMNEIAKYFEFFLYIQKYNFASEKLLKNDHSEIFRYYFFRENLQFIINRNNIDNLI